MPTREESAAASTEWQDRFDWNEELGLWVHRESDCAGGSCCIHSPSDHPLRDAPRAWRSDRNMVERTCPHGVGHPDPDDLAYKELVDPEMFAAGGFGVHGCDGCCAKEEK